MRARGWVVSVGGVGACDSGSIPSGGKLFSKMCSESSVSLFVLAIDVYTISFTKKKWN